MSLFDRVFSIFLRDKGIEKVSSWPNDEWIASARSVAIYIARRDGTVTINDVLKVFPKPPCVHPNAIGSVMRTVELKRIGFVKSDKVSAHARNIGVYSFNYSKKGNV